MGADLEQVDKIDASEFHNVKLNAREMISPKLVTNPKTADGQVKLFGADQVLRTSTSMGGPSTHNEEKFKKTFLENQTGFHQPTKQEVIAHQHSLYRDQ